MKVELKTITPNAEINIVEIARVSSTREDKTEKPEGLLRYLINNKHWSPFQHSYLTFKITTSKAIGIQLLRHLSFTFQEFSQRYAKVDTIEPVEFRLKAEKNRQSSSVVIGNVIHMTEISHNTFEVLLDDGFTEDVKKAHKYFNWLERVSKNMNDSLELYLEGVEELGVAKECARMILPMATQTTIYMTGSVRSWIHFIQIRDEGHAQKEAQLIAKEIKKLFTQELPIVAKALEYDSTREIGAAS